MKKFFALVLIIMMLAPLSASGLNIFGASTNTSAPFSIVTTNAAGVLLTSATLNGTAYNYNSTGTSFFNYGLTTAYGTITTPAVFVGNTTSTAFSAAISGLTTGSTYHFQACVTNSAGTVCGGDLTFVPNNPLVRIGTLTISGGINGGLVGNSVDSAGAFLYLCNSVSASKVAKVNLSSFTQVGTYTSGNNFCSSGILDKVNGLYYMHAFSPVNSHTYIEKITVSAMTGVVIIDNTTDNTANKNNGYPTVDNVNSKIYWPHTNGGGTQQINRFNSGGSPNDAINAQSGALFFNGINTIWSGNSVPGAGVQTSTAVPFTAGGTTAGSPGASSSVAVDSSTGNIYFGNEQNNLIFLLNTSAMTTSTFASALCSTGSLSNINIDSTRGYIYFVCKASPVTVGAVRLSDGSIAQRLVLNTGENITQNFYTNTSVDIVNHFLYVGTSSNLLVKVQLN